MNRIQKHKTSCSGVRHSDVRRSMSRAVVMISRATHVQCTTCSGYVVDVRNGLDCALIVITT